MVGFGQHSLILSQTENESFPSAKDSVACLGKWLRMEIHLCLRKFFEVFAFSYNVSALLECCVRFLMFQCANSSVVSPNEI